MVKYITQLDIILFSFAGSVPKIKISLCFHLTAVILMSHQCGATGDLSPGDTTNDATHGMAPCHTRPVYVYLLYIYLHV